MGILRNCSGLVAAAAVFATSPVAHAAFSIEPAVAPVVNVVAGGASGVPLGQAAPTLTFNFVEPYPFARLDLQIGYDPLKLSFDYASSSAVFQLPGGLPSFTLDDLVTLTGGDFSYSSDVSTPGAYSLIATFATQSQTLPAGASLVLTGLFDLDALPLGQSTNVAMSGILTSTVAVVDPSAVNAFAVNAAVTAVPEPETWLMLLGGLALLASRVRRRAR